MVLDRIFFIVKSLNFENEPFSNANQDIRMYLAFYFFIFDVINIFSIISLSRTIHSEMCLIDFQDNGSARKTNFHMKGFRHIILTKILKTLTYMYFLWHYRDTQN